MLHWCSCITGVTAESRLEHAHTLKHDDERLEIVGLRNTIWNLGVGRLLRCCTTFPKVASKKGVRYTVDSTVCVQLDGEAWRQVASLDDPCEIEISRPAGTHQQFPACMRMARRKVR